MNATERMAGLMARSEEDVPLDEACLLVGARATHRDEPDTVVSRGLDLLDELAGHSPHDVDDLRAYLFDQSGFRGSVRNYADPRNSYLDQVIVRRLGIPITLSVLTVEVGRRVGLDLDPVGMPGHFIVGVGDGRFMDPFHGGAFLTVGDCRRRFENLAGSDSEWTSDFLQPSGTWSVLARILANLRQSFIAANDPAGLDWVLELRACIPGVPVQERAQRASVLATLGRYDEAAGELEALATAEESGATKHPSVAPDNSTEQTVAELRHRAARLRAKLN